MVIDETRRFKQEAEFVKEGNTGGNITRTILFWPALVKTIHNADVAIRAANDRAYHLINIMKNKNCKEVLINFILNLLKLIRLLYLMN